jgi:hypothetical protein
MHSVISTAIKIDFTVGKTFRFFMNEITKRFFLFQTFHHWRFCLRRWQVCFRLMIQSNFKQSHSLLEQEYFLGCPESQNPLKMKHHKH